MHGTLAPGARVVIRDEEWLLRRVDPSSDGGELLWCDGVSELVRGRTARRSCRDEGLNKLSRMTPIVRRAGLTIREQRCATA
ncbi:MAG: hypothetical protein MUE46_02905 [Xanthomonadales bacterium]|jgi:hypothetical protein|nr:hypothetical protein [Xanthomonadales bacterium]